MESVVPALERTLQMKIDPRSAKEIERAAAVLQLPAGQIVLLEGEEAHSLYFLLQGIVRGYYIDAGGNDVTKCFSSEGEFFSTEGLRTRHPSSFTIECLEDCRCVSFPYPLIQKVLAHDEALRTQINCRYLDEIEVAELRAKNRLILNAEERYQDFCHRFPELCRRVELRHIASYIGIRPASLSRIRKNRP